MSTCDHKPVQLTEAQIAAYRQFKEAIEKGKTQLSMYGMAALTFEEAWKQIGEINGVPIHDMARTGKMRACPQCMRAVPVILRELADMYEELASALKLPETTHKTKFGI